MQARTDARILREKAEFFGQRFDHEAAAAGSVHVDEWNAANHLRRYDSRSHGESFVDVSFDSPPIRELHYDDLEHVNVMRDFLNDPENHLR